MWSAEAGPDLQCGPPSDCPISSCSDPPPGRGAGSRDRPIAPDRPAVGAHGAPGSRPPVGTAAAARALPMPDPPWVPAAPGGRRARRSPQRHQAASSMVFTAAPAPWLRLDQAASAGRGEGRHRRGAGRGRRGRGASGLWVPSGGQSQFHNFTPHFLEQPSSSSTSSAARDWEPRAPGSPPHPSNCIPARLGVAALSFTFSLPAQAWVRRALRPDAWLARCSSHPFPKSRPSLYPSLLSRVLSSTFLGRLHLTPSHS